MFRTLTTGYTECERWCVMEDMCVSFNIGRTLEGGVICELSDSDHCQHPEDLKPRGDWIYRGAEVCHVISKDKYSRRLDFTLCSLHWNFLKTKQENTNIQPQP